MPYKVYITDALVCGHKNLNTSDKVYQLFTREAGMLWVTAQSVRMEKSKHRYALQDFSHIRVSLVRGKGGWRIVSSEVQDNLYYTTSNRYTRATVRNVLRLLRRVVRGEEAHAGLFDDVMHGFAHLGVVADTPLETVLMLRIMYALGYVPAAAHYDAVLAENYEYTTVEALTSDTLTACKTTLTQAIAHSQL